MVNLFLVLKPVTPDGGNVEPQNLKINSSLRIETLLNNRE
jgi:hypothetical protein